MHVLRHARLHVERGCTGSALLEGLRLLAPCPACAQVVEVAGMADHLLDECEHKDEYTSCATTGLAIKKNELRDWNASAECKPCPTGTMYCPLCLGFVEDTDDAWRSHLFENCPKNTRCPKAK